MLKVGFFTLGCKVNQQETAALAARFKEAGFEEVGFSQKADIYVINSCAVTADAERKSLTIARRKKRQEQAFVILAGCFPQVALEKATLSGVDLLVGSNDKSRIVELVILSQRDRVNPMVSVSEWNKDTHFEIISDSFNPGRARATLKIQDGCEQFCSYCIVPYARGPERSLFAESVINQATELVAQGFKEVVLSGIHLGAYGKDLHPQFSLARLLLRLSAIGGLERVRLGSVEPTDLTPELIGVLTTGKVVCNHVHIPLQSGSDAVLRRMNRHYTTSDFLHPVHKLRDALPNIGITSDLIVGFPGESESEFAETAEFISIVAFSRLHIFRYSKRDGTPAATMLDQVPEHVKEERKRLVSEVANVATQRFHNQLIGKKVSVLVESRSGKFLVGHTSCYVKVFLVGTEKLIGKLVDVEINSASSEGVYGQLGRILR